MLKKYCISKFLLTLFLVLFTSNLKAQDNNYLSLSAGAFDFNKKIKKSTLVRLEYRSGNKILFLNPITGVMVNTDGGFFIFAGITTDLHLDKFLVLTPSFAPGYYNKGNSKELFYALEFRTKLELALKFNNNYRLGFSLSHISNASLGPPNPGVENLAINFTIPL